MTDSSLALILLTLPQLPCLKQDVDKFKYLLSQNGCRQIPNQNLDWFSPPLLMPLTTVFRVSLEGPDSP